MPNFEYRNLAYTTPGGKRFEFTYNGDLSDGKTHNLAEFTFSGVDEKYFQDRTISSDEFPFTLSITDQALLQEIREAFDEKIEPGKTGTLEHPDPTIGNFPAVIASAKFVQNAVKGIGVATVSVIFYRTIPNLLAGDASEAEGSASISSTYSAIEEISDNEAESFGDTVTTKTGQGAKALIANARNALNRAKSAFSSIAAKVDRVNILFTNTYATALSDIDALARSPVDLARKIQTLIQLPMMASESVKERYTAYQNYVNETFNLSEDDQKNIEAGNEPGKNTLSVVSLAATAALQSVAFSVTTGTSMTRQDITAGKSIQEFGYLSRMDIISAISQLQELSDLVTETLSGYAESFGDVLFFDQFFDYSILNKKLIARAIKNLNARLFNANAEKIYVTEKETNIICLSAKLYNSVDVNTLQFLADTNDIHGDELYLVRSGREIKYY
jgi:hypothetical protein